MFWKDRRETGRVPGRIRRSTDSGGYGRMTGKQILIIGAGASGMMAAVSSAVHGARVTLLDHNAKPGRKLLLTGNGRCNLTNLDPHLWEKYHSSDPEALALCCRTLKRRMNTDRTLELFREMGLLTTDRDGYVYPLSESASSVLGVLEREMQMRGIRRKYAQQITGIERDEANGEWLVHAGGYSYRGDCVILCCGSRAYASTGSDGSGYELAAGTGHTIVSVLPSLTGLQCSSRDILECAGSRCMAGVSVVDPVTGERASDTGQVQFGKDGISGIVVFQVSGAAARFLASGHRVSASLDFLPMWPVEETERFLHDQMERACNDRMKRSGGAELSSTEIREILQGILPAKIAGLMAGRFMGESLKRADNAGRCSRDAARMLAEKLKTFAFPVSGVRGFEQAQVCSGGVALSQIDPVTFESKIAPGLYFAGEILDADGPCGGYNLQWAWSSGYVAGACAAQQADHSRTPSAFFPRRTQGY